MMLEGWVWLWSIMLWLSMATLGLLAAYVLFGFIRGMRRRP